MAIGTLTISIAGTYAGSIISHLQKRKLTNKWFVISTILGATYFSGIELLHHYFEHCKIYHNYWIDSSIVGYSLYSGLYTLNRRKSYGIF